MGRFACLFISLDDNREKNVCLVLNTPEMSMVTTTPSMGGEKVMRQISSAEFGGCFCVHKCEFP